MSLGGDCDTLAAVIGSIAEAFYGTPEDLKQEYRKRLMPESERYCKRVKMRFYSGKNYGKL